MSLEDRFWSKVTVKDGCWCWSGAKSQGYGVLNLGPRGAGLIRAHRLSYILHKGEIPAGKLVLHQCDNPECTNPDHLKVGDCAENMRHVSERKRNPRSKQTHCRNGHEFTADNTILKRGGRSCRKCKNENQRRRLKEKRGDDFGKIVRNTRLECKNGHKFMPETTYWNPLGYRECKVCRQAKMKQWTDRHK